MTFQPCQLSGNGCVPGTESVSLATSTFDGTLLIPPARGQFDAPLPHWAVSLLVRLIFKLGRSIHPLKPKSDAELGSNHHCTSLSGRQPTVFGGASINRSRCWQGNRYWLNTPLWNIHFSRPSSGVPVLPLLVDTRTC